jgi:hypothetical protein
VPEVTAVTVMTAPVAGLTVATPSLDDDQVTLAPGIAAPPASRTTAVSSAVPPAEVRVTALGVISTDAGTGAGNSTVTLAVPEAVPLVAVIVDDPSSSAVTRPVELTVAAVWFDELQFTEAPLMMFPCPSRTVAESCWVAPAEVSVTVPGVTWTCAGWGLGVGSVEESPPQETMRSAVATAVAIRQDTARAVIVTPAVEGRRSSDGGGRSSAGSPWQRQNSLLYLPEPSPATRMFMAGKGRGWRRYGVDLHHSQTWVVCIGLPVALTRRHFFKIMSRA